jgi:YHS domain-containing protein
MKFATLAASVVLALGVAGCAAYAAAGQKDQKDPAATTQPAAAAAAAPVNKKCPVSGDDVNPKGKTVVYKGKTVGFCCNDCIDLFNKNPDKYADKIK